MSDPSLKDSAQAALVVEAESASADAPAVVAVVVVRAGDPQVVETLTSIGAQDYANLSVLVIDGTAEGLSDRLANLLPDAFIHRFTGTPGFAAASNRAIDLVDGGGFFLFCNERVAMEPDCVSSLVEELYRSNAGIVTPKYVQWDDPRRLVAIGMGSDRFGVQVDLVEPGDFDQEQYDAVQDVFVAPEGVQLVRADLFRTLGGFDETMESVSEDLDLCWRAHVAGARVVAVPEAKVRIRQPDWGDDQREADRAVDRRRRLLGRNRLRTLLVTGTRFSLLRVLPLAVLLLVLEGIYSLIAGRRRQSAAAFAALGSNLGRLGEIRQRRTDLAELRQASDRDVHALQVGGSARLSAFFRGQFSVSDRVMASVTSVRESFTGEGSSAARDATLIGSFVGLLLFLGSRSLIQDGVSPVGQFLDLPGGGTLLREWFGSWRGSGTGGPGHAPTAYAVLGVFRGFFFWADGFAHLLLALVPVGLGAVGAWRLAAPLASPRAAALAMLAYVGNPLLGAIFSAGRWDSLVIWAASPWLLLSILSIQGLAPFGQGPRSGAAEVDGDNSSSTGPAARPLTVLRFGILVAIVATFVPAVVPVTLVLVAAAAVGALLAGRASGAGRLIPAAVAAVVVPGALHGLWTVEVVRHFSWDWFVGTSSPESVFDSLADLLRFAPGLEGPQPLALGLLVAAFVPLLISNAARLEVSIRAWAVAASFFAIAWADRRGWLPFAVPSPELLLAPAAAGLSLSVGAGVRALDIDLVGYRFGWRQLAGFVGVVAMAASALLLFRASFDGRWQQPEQSYSRSTQLLADRIEGPTRMLWIGDPSVLPIDTASSADGISFAVSSGSADVLGRWTPEPLGSEALIGSRLDLAGQGQTARLGHLLAPYGIDVIVVVPQLAPAPYTGPEVSPGSAQSFLRRQLDLERVPGTPDLSVYRNVASAGPVVTAVDPLPAQGDALTQLNTDLIAGQRAVATFDRTGRFTVQPPEAGVETLIAVPAAEWEVTGPEGEAASTGTAFGGLLTIDATGGPHTVEYPNSLFHRLLLVAQVVLVAVTLVLARLPAEEGR